MASLAPLRIIQLCFYPKAPSYALHSISDIESLGFRISVKVTRINVKSHIILSKFREVELYFLNYLGALRELLLSPL